jgi:hypothetical protein
MPKTLTVVLPTPHNSRAPALAHARVRNGFALAVGAPMSRLARAAGPAFAPARISPPKGGPL